MRYKWRSKGIVSVHSSKDARIVPLLVFETVYCRAGAKLYVLRGAEEFFLEDVNKDKLLLISTRCHPFCKILITLQPLNVLHRSRKDNHIREDMKKLSSKFHLGSNKDEKDKEKKKDKEEGDVTMGSHRASLPVKEPVTPSKTPTSSAPSSAPVTPAHPAGTSAPVAPAHATLTSAPITPYTPDSQSAYPTSAQQTPNRQLDSSQNITPQKSIEALRREAELAAAAQAAETARVEAERQAALKKNIIDSLKSPNLQDLPTPAVGGATAKNKFLQAAHAARAAAAVVKEKEKEMEALNKAQELPEYLRLNETFISPHFDNLAHIVLGIVSSWIIGSLGFSLFWVFVVFYFVGRLDTRRLHRLWKREYNIYSKTRLHGNTTRHAQDTSKEGAEWINSIIEKAWPKLGPYIYDMAKKQIQEQINVKLRPKLPPQLESLDLVELDLGRATPKISEIKTYPQISMDHYKVDMHLGYLGDISGLAVATVKTEYATLTIPIKIENIHFSSDLLFFFDLMNSPPFIKTMYLSFKNVSLDLSLKPLRLLDLIDIPFVQPLLESTVREVLMATPIVIDLATGTVAVAQGDGKALISKKKKKNAFAAFNPLSIGSNLGKAIGLMKKDEIVVEKLYTSIISVKLIEARGLIASDSNGKSDPYVKLYFQGQEEKSLVIMKTLDPVWNSFFQFFVDDSVKERVLVAEVYDWDRMDADDFLGKCYIDFSELQNDDDKKDYWMSLVDENGKAMRTGQLHVHIAYYVG
ncbi:hypothetical protein PROFUN_02004 [Planoprotostelium fungivorum]|uniref:C2 domain-containing protein n=1 Tax=Planoprotostelium fungivorum TaxID=1890364 RepID=A0A2P6NB44_9EUKA|nr:hypothetical protein PROFUN_02004 [Planoprotostelium fungivorum]